uniref:Uncharacterized protein n=1 Tax=Meloidogyne enterolobii TaxID=390850 RepID=A0A6V7TYH7_MELEN|nr:unnamed protein product [Meloidogyne enterolobii]
MGLLFMIFEKAEQEQLEYLRLYKQMTQSQENCVKNQKHLSYLFKQLRKDFKSLQESNLNEEEKNILTEKKASIDQYTSKLAEMQRELPIRENGLYLSTILGSNLNISLLNSDERYKYKKEYESFKLSVTFVILAVFVLAYILPPFRIIDALCNFLLVWYYCTLTIRESILRLNGSRIKGWWVLHHYISCVLCGITLTWRDGDCYDQFRHVFIYFVCYIGSVQIIQYKYQTGCLRRLHALGQRHCMDVTLEGFSSWMFKGLTFLLPFLIVGYAFQGYCSYRLFDIYLHKDCSREWQVIVLAIMFAIIFIGNSVTLGLVIIKKYAKSDLSKLPNKYRDKTL